MNLPHNRSSQEYKNFLNKKDFYICLIIINSACDRFTRKVIHTKISHILDGLLVTEKGKKINWDSSIHYFNSYEECDNHFNQQIDDACEVFNEKVEQMKKKYNAMLKLKVNTRELKLNRILKGE